MATLALRLCPLLTFSQQRSIGHKFRCPRCSLRVDVGELVVDADAKQTLFHEAAVLRTQACPTTTTAGPVAAPPCYDKGGAVPLPSAPVS
jgi:hypothetical protein